MIEPNYILFLNLMIGYFAIVSLHAIANGAAKYMKDESGTAEFITGLLFLSAIIWVLVK